MRRFPAFLCLLWAVTWATLGVYGAVSNPLATAFKIQGPDATGNSGYPLAVVQATGSSWPFSGNLTNNNAAPAATNIGALSGLANAAAPTWTEGDQVLLSETLAGNLRTTGVGGTFPVTNSALTAATPADAFTAPGAIGQSQSFPQVYNGTTWDLARSANSATATSGTGLLGAGAIGWDGSVWRKLLVDTNGRVCTTVPSTITGTGTVTTTMAAMAAEGGTTARVLAVGNFFYNGANMIVFRSNAAAPTTDSRLAVSPGTGNMTSLSAVTGTGAGTAFNLGTATHEFGVQITTTGSPASVSVTLQGSLDAGTTWTNIGSAITGTGTSLTFFTGSPVTDVRLNLGTFSGGTSPTLTGIICGY